MTTLTHEQVEANITEYVGDRDETARYASFDYCFNYFHSFYEEGRVEDLVAAEHLQTSCLHLGFYLASWGMFRGKSQLLQGSMKHYIPLLEEVVQRSDLFALDVPDYDRESIEVLLRGFQRVRSGFPHPATPTLVTKVMLGVFGCVPAFDRYFRMGFGASTFGRKSLKGIRDFYDQHSSLIDGYRIPTIDFETGHETDLKYTAAKVIDMVFFTEGMKPGLGLE